MNFIKEKINSTCQALAELKEETVLQLSEMKYIECGYKTSNNLPQVDDNWKPLSREQKIGGKDKHFWLHHKFKTPSEISEECELLLELTTSKEGVWDATNPQCVLYLNGKLVQGLDINHTTSPLEFDTEYDMYIYLYSGMIDSLIEAEASIKLVDKRIESLLYDIRVPYDAALCLDEGDYNRVTILKHLEIAVNMLDLCVLPSDKFYKSIDDASAYLENEFYKKVCGSNGNNATVSCIGHTHIDVAWLWTLAQTREKIQRSFSTVVRLMKQYPEYKFMSSQPQLYKYIKEDAPELYAEIKQLVKEGRWEVEGAMWLEADCNLSSGEGLVRQILFGKRFINKEFGVDSNILWLPDVFGYSAALPQILIKSGVDKFVTSKISWNEFNKLPYDTFMWEGIDGTEIFTYFITAQDFDKNRENDNETTYVGYIRPKQVLGTWKRYQQKEFNDNTVITFGFGDGGGGPTADMLEQQRRLVHGIPGFPKTEIRKAGEFLDIVQSNFNKNCTLLKRTPKWVGELYLELHRGTYTSVAKNKKNNRKSELLYGQTEALSVFDKIINGSLYPQKELNDGWETILLNQFHDILPGSSIFEVYEECDRQYSEIIDVAQKLQEQKLSGIAKNIKTNGGTLVYNPNSFSCDGVVDINGKKAVALGVPAFGWKVVSNTTAENTITVTDNELQSKFYKVVLDENGDITSIFDKENNREVIKQGEKANEMQIFEDFPKCYDAWEITNYYKQKQYTIDSVTDRKIIDEGGRKGLKITKKYDKSTITQTIFLYENSRRIDFDTHIDWHQEHVLLKASFPLDIKASKATYDIQFGNVERSTHENTSWDAAQFEVCAHKWADINEDGYGVSLLNDCKYGYSCEGSTMKLTLLKCATYPNPHADKGEHTFTYSLYPHKGNFKEGNTVQEAYLLNQPFVCLNIGKQEGALPEQYSFVNCDLDNIIIETVKKAEDSDDIVIRLYDAYNRRCTPTVNFGFDITGAYIADMMENKLSSLPFENNSVKLEVKPFEIVTLMLSGK